MSELFASVHILDVPYHADRAYDYFVPPELRADLSVGTLVCVPYGTANRKVPAVVTELHGECAFENVKPVFSLLTSGAALNEEMLSLCAFLKEHTLCTIGDAVRAAVPPAAISKTTEYLLKTITFPHSPQVFPQGFSTDTHACGYTFRLT